MNLFNIRPSRKSSSGFTLIEMIVSLGVFTVVALVAVGALMKIMDANRKALTLKTAINNLNFALESMSREMRVGTDYGEQADTGSEKKWRVNFKTKKNGVSGCNVSYKFQDSTLQKGQNCSAPVVADSDFQDLISPDIVITDSTLDLHEETSKEQAWASFSFDGYVGKKEKDKTYFSIQTKVSQRIRD